MPIPLTTIDHDNKSYQQVGGTDEDVEAVLHQYATGALDASKTRRAVKKHGYTIDSLRGDDHEVPVYRPDGTRVYLGT